MKTKKTNQISLFSSAVLLASISLTASTNSAQAIVIRSELDDFTVDWELLTSENDNDGGMPPIDLRARAVVDVTSFTQNQLVMDIKFSNLTMLSGAITEAGIVSFGIAVEPDATGVVFTDSNSTGFESAEIQTTGQQNFPGGFKQIDVCVFTQGCSGGAQNTALAAGEMDQFQLAIDGNFGNPVEVRLDQFPIKFQTSQNSFEFAGNETPLETPFEVPEPSTILGLSLFALATAATTGNKSS
ncbi:MAG: PEP-CTERM sorting domain-containing protein [Cyanobacteria bacterium J083]|nr:MAG: PEP-CTERM sorting domain-containing protein [Cyanobacteria bacterium J083]